MDTATPRLGTQAPSDPLDGLLPHHQRMLVDESGIAPDVVRRRGYRSLEDRTELRDLGFKQAGLTVPGLLLPGWGPSGENGRYVYRPDAPPVEPNGRPRKYLLPPGSRAFLDVPPACTEALRDPRVPLYIVEGQKKADAGVSKGLCVVALLGVDMWRGKNAYGAVTTLDEWQDVAWAGPEGPRFVAVVFDSDVVTNPRVWRTRRKFRNWLQHVKQARVACPTLPAGPNGEKVGLDDYLLTHSVAELEALADQPEPEEPPEEPDPVLGGQPPAPGWDGPAGQEPAIDGYPLTDLGNAERLLAAYGDRLRFVEAWGRWIVWDGRAWHLDVAGVEAKHLCNRVVRAMGAFAAAHATTHGKAAKRLRDFARKCEYRGAEAAMLAKAATFPTLLVSPDALDADRDRLNCANGIVDLTTGRRQPPDPAALMTMLAPTAYDPVARCPRWERFVAEVTEHADGTPDPAYAAWLQRLAGYAATGRVSEQVLPFLHGDGSNGKNTFVEALLAVLGPYGGVAPPHFLRQRKHDEHLTEIADLYRRRLILVDETQQGARLDEDKVKLLTGSQRRKCRRMREDLWEYDATDTMVILGNHKPEIQGDDYAIWRRVKLAPFDAKFVGADEPTPPGQLRRVRDPGLAAALEQERPGILAWIVRGAVAWYRQGLAPLPERVQEASDRYRQEQDVLGPFFDERCAFGAGLEVYATPLYAAFKEWVEARGERAGSQKAFGGRMGAKGYRSVAGTGNRQKYPGIGLRDPDDRTPPEPPPTPGVNHPDPAVPESGVNQVTEVPVPPPTPERVCAPAHAHARKEGSYGELLTPLTPNLEEDAEIVNSAPALPEDCALCGADVEAYTPDGHARCEAHAHVVYVTDAAGLARELPGLLAAPRLGLDVETTGLSPRADRLRLVQLATGARTVLVDAFAVDVAPLAPLFAGAGAGAGPQLVGHNLLFDLGFLAAAGLPLPDGTRLVDTLLAERVGDRGEHFGAEHKGYFTLEALAQRALGVGLDKTEQAGGWDAPELPPAKLRYAAQDAEILLPLADAVQGALEEAGLTPVARLECEALPVVVWTEATGVPLDVPAWTALAERAEAALAPAREALVAHARALGDDYLDAVCPYPPALQQPTKTGKERKKPARAFNPASAVQQLRLLAALGVPLPNTQEATLEANAQKHAAVADLLAAKRVEKYATTFGRAYVAKHVDPATGRVHGKYFPLGTRAGRMSAGTPNVQQVPHARAYRDCVRAPAGRVLVKCDYSQIELRIIAEVAGDEPLIAALNGGADLHTLTAAVVFGVPEADVTPQQRAFGKTLNFGVMYGMGAARLVRSLAEQGVTLSEGQARAYIAKFNAQWRGVERWRRDQMNRPESTVVTAAGRQRLLEPDAHATEKINTPIQGLGADILKAALAELWATRDRCPSGAPILLVHDEVVVEVDEAEAEAGRAWVTEAMRAGGRRYLSRVEVKVDATVAPTWGGPD